MSVSRTVSENYTEDFFLMLDQADRLIDEDKDDEAIEIHSKVIAAYPEEPYAYAIRGWVFLKQKKYALAIRDFSTALEKKPNAPNTLFLRARAYESIGKLQQAIEDYKKYIEYKPNDPEAYLYLGWIFEYLKDYKNASKNYTISNTLEQSNYLEEKIEWISNMEL